MPRNQWRCCPAQCRLIQVFFVVATTPSEQQRQPRVVTGLDEAAGFDGDCCLLEVKKQQQHTNNLFPFLLVEEIFFTNNQMTVLFPLDYVFEVELPSSQMIRSWSPIFKWLYVRMLLECVRSILLFFFSSWAQLSSSCAIQVWLLPAKSENRRWPLGVNKVNTKQFIDPMSGLPSYSDCFSWLFFHTWPSSFSLSGVCCWKMAETFCGRSHF